jgi:uncharacterized protein YbjT (DUF2867 family)
MSHFTAKKVKLAIIGGTGAVGKEIIRHAKNDTRIEKLAIITRRTLDEWNQSDFKPLIQIIKKDNFGNFDNIKTSLQGYDGFISTLGADLTTPNEQFRTVEKTYPLAFANLAKELNVGYFFYLSSAGSNPNAWFKLFKVKGETDQEL